jgi:hypothetical protein
LGQGRRYGAKMNTQSSTPSSIPDSGISTVVPYKNVPALVGYYCGVFSLVCPCFLLGLFGFIFGMIGLKRAKEHPEAKGKAHAWIGIILGGLAGLLYLCLAVFWITGPMLARR